MRLFLHRKNMALLYYDITWEKNLLQLDKYHHCYSMVCLKM